MEQILALVAVEHVAYHFDVLYGYLIPQALRAKAKPGSRVLVSFGNGSGRRQGVIFAMDAPQEGKRYKALLDVLDDAPLLSEEMLALARFLKDRTFCTFFEAAKVQLPASFNVRVTAAYAAVQPLPAVRLTAAEQAVYDVLCAEGRALEKKELLRLCDQNGADEALARLVRKQCVQRNYTPTHGVGDLTVKTAALAPAFGSAEQLPDDLTEKQRRVAETLLDVGAASVKELCYFTGVTSAVIKNLEKRGVLTVFDRGTYRVPQVQTMDRAAKQDITLTPAQQTAFRNLRRQYETAGGTALLYGVTGSGKTSVFLKLIDSVLADGKQVIMMVPEISLTPQMMAIFKGRYGDAVAIFHSALSAGERKDEYRRVRDGAVKIALGTRSAVFAPFDNLGLIVMDEEQEHTYKSEGAPRYHARDVAKFRARRHGALLLLASATPSVESYSYAEKGIYSLHTLPERYGAAVLPDVTVVDLKLDRQRGNRHTISIPLLDLLQKNLDAGKQSILLMNRRGYNTFVACDSCGEVASCPSCSISLTYHAANGRLMCHYCGYSAPFTTRCAHCGKNTLRYAGTGTQKIEEELKTLLPGARVVRMDTDAAATRDAFEKKLLAFGSGEYDIMIGTQMVAKGLNFENVTLVGVLNADLSLHNDDYRSEERTFDLLTQVVGRSGRGESRGIALIQTMTPENGVIRLAQKQDYPAFFDTEIKIRKALIYPPYCDLCVLFCSGEDEAKTLRAAQSLLEQLKALAAGEYADQKLIVLPVMPPRIGKVNNRFRFRIIIKCKNTRRFREMIGRLLAEFGGRAEWNDVSFSADVDPETLI
ncbi:MAG: primosomal protein N' [Clostridia bacterium]|nr:primosomal protein N' [Clostridia bacterium]MBR3552351.1 primosomal protein N' [Clostridia bacterium]